MMPRKDKHELPIPSWRDVHRYIKTVEKSDELDRILHAVRCQRAAIVLKAQPPSHRCEVPGLFRILTERAISHVELERALDLPRQNGRLTHWKKGTASPGLTLAIRMAAHLGVTLDELVKP